MSAIAYWKCPECMALVSNETTTCGACGTEIPEEWS